MSKFRGKKFFILTAIVMLSAGQLFLGNFFQNAQADTCSINSFTADNSNPTYNTSTTIRSSLSGSYAWSVNVIVGADAGFPASGTSTGSAINTSNITQTTIYRLTCGSDIADVSLVTSSMVITPPLFKSSNTDLDATVSCSYIRLKVTDLSTSEDGWAIFRNTTSSTSSADRITTIYSTTKSATSTLYSYTDNPPGGVTYYYWAQGYATSVPSSLSLDPNEFSAASNIPPSSFGVAPTACSSALYSSDNDVVTVNGTNIGSGTGNQCGSTDVLPSGLVLRLNDKLKFSVNLCNTGAATASSISITDTLLNLKQPVTGWAAQYCVLASCSSVTPTATGTEPRQTLTFSGLANVAAGTNNRLTFEARLAVPASFGGVTGRFQNQFSIGFYTGGSNATTTGATPLWLFLAGPGQPSFREVPPQ